MAAGTVRVSIRVMNRMGMIGEKALSMGKMVGHVCVYVK